MRSLPFIVALGGSAVAPNGINYPLLRRFRQLIQKRVRRGNRFIIVIGGGNIAREYQNAIAKLSPKTKNIERDAVGIRATQLNAELVRVILGTGVHHKIITSPKHLDRIRKPIAVASGWTPGSSTDTVAVDIAKRIGSKSVIVAGKPAYVYERDRAIDPHAKAFKELTWRDYSKLVAKQWVPGLSTPVDPVAAKRAERADIHVTVVSGNDPTNLEKLLNNKPFKGTTIVKSRS